MLAAVPRWLAPTAIAALVAAAGATLTLSGTDIALTASMRVFDHVGLLGLVVAACGPSPRWLGASSMGQCPGDGTRCCSLSSCPP